MRNVHAIASWFARPTRALAALGLVVTIVTGASSAKAPADAPSPSRYLPEHQLVAYLEYEGLAAHAKAWQGTAARGMIETEPVGVMVDAITTQLLDRVLKELPDVKLHGADLLAIHHEVIQQGLALAAYDHGGCAVVLNGFGNKPRRERFERVLKAIDDSQGTKPSAPARIRGRDVHQVVADGRKEPAVLRGERDLEPLVNPPPKEDPRNEPPAPSLSWWFEGNDLIVLFGPDAAAPDKPAVDPPKVPLALTHNEFRNAVLDTIEAKRPNASTHRGFVSAREEGGDIAGFEPTGLFFVELAGNAGLLDALLEGAIAPFDSLSLSGLNLTSQIQGRGSVPLERSLNARRVRVEEVHVDRAEVKPLPFPEPVGPLLVAPAPPDGPPPNVPVPPDGPPPTIPTLPEGPHPVAPSPPMLPPGQDSPDAPPPFPLPDSDAPLAPPQAPPAFPTPLELPANPFKTEPPLSPDDPRAKAQAEKEQREKRELLGLGGMTRLVGRWGFQGKGLVTNVRLETRAPHTGLLGLVDQPSFRKDKLPPIPASVGSFVVGSLDPGASYDKVVAMLKKAEPEIAGPIEALEKTVRDATGLELRRDLLAQLGPSWCSFEIPDPTRAKDDPTGYVLVVEIQDAVAFGKTLDTFVKLANKTLLDMEAGDGPGARKDGDPPILAWERLAGPERGYELTSPAGLVSWANDETRPTILVGKSYVAFALNPARARVALAAETRPGAGWRPLGEVARTFAGLPAGLTSLSVADPSNSPWPVYLSSLPALVQSGSNMLGFASRDEASLTSGVQAALGIPGPGGFRVRVPPGTIPRAAALRSYLFPSVLATTVDDHGVRWIGREAFPFGCIGGGTLTKPSITYNLSNPKQSTFKYNLDILRALGK